MISYIEGVVDSISQKGLFKEIELETNEGFKTEKAVIFKNVISVKDSDDIIHDIVVDNKENPLSTGNKVFIFYENNIAKEIYCSENDVIERIEKHYNPYKDIITITTQNKKEGWIKNIFNVLGFGIFCITAGYLFVVMPFYLLNRIIMHIEAITNFLNNNIYSVALGGGVMFFIFLFICILLHEKNKENQYKKVYSNYKKKIPQAFPNKKSVIKEKILHS